jgi:hypothetical protein
MEFLSVLEERSGGRYPLGTTLMRGLSDLLAAVYGSPDFIFELTDRPDVQKRIIEKITDLWISFADLQLEAIPLFHGGVGSLLYNIWLPGRGTWLQEDASALLSPRLFGEFIYPALVEMIDHFDSTIIHLHPSTYIPVEYLVKTDLLAIELHIDRGGPRAEELLPVYRKVQESKPLIIWGDVTPDDVDFIARKLDTRSLAVLVAVESGEEAESVWRRLKR